MRVTFVSVVLVSSLSGLLVADELDDLIQEYTKARAQAGRRGGPGGRGGGFPGRRGGGDARATAERVLGEIGRLGTDRALKFLIDEIHRAPDFLASASARAALEGRHPRGPNVVFGLLASRRSQVWTAVLDAVVPEEDPGWRGGFGRRPRREGVEVEWKKVEKELLAAVRAAKDIELRRRLVPVLAKLGGVSGARGIVELSSGGARPEPDEDELHLSAVEELVKIGEGAEVRAWLETESLSFARSDPGRLAVVAEAAGRLEIALLRPEVEDLLTKRHDRLFVAAAKGLSFLPGDLSEEAVETIERRLDRRMRNTDRAAILDALARDGSSHALEVVLEAAKGRDWTARAIAVGSLALVLAKPTAVRALVAALEDQKFEVRSNALRALRKAKVKEVIPALIERLDKEPIPRLRADALRILIDSTGHDMGFVAEDWRKWWTVAAADFEFGETEEGGRTRVAKNSYFGIEVASTRIAFVLDVSWSMDRMGGGFGRRRQENSGEKTKLDLMKEELTRLIGEMSDETLINIITFSGTIQTWSRELEPLARGGRARAIRFVESLATGAGTNVFDSVERALANSGVDTIYLLTDGRPTTGRYTGTPGILRGIEELNRVRGITIHCIAFGEESDLLRRIAEANGGIYRFILPEAASRQTL